MLSDLAPLAAGKGDALLLADCVTSLGGVPVQLDDWGVDLAYSGSQKCLGVAPGLAPFTINDRAWERRIEKPQSWYLDLGLLGGYAGEAAGSGGGPTTTPRRPAWSSRCTPGSAGSSTRGWRPSTPGTPRPGGCCTTGLQELGLELFAAEGHRLPELTTVQRARRRRLGRRPQGAARALRPGDRRGSGRLRRHRLADRPHGPERRRRTRSPSCWPPWRRSSAAEASAAVDHRQWRPRRRVDQPHADDQPRSGRQPRLMQGAPRPVDHGGRPVDVAAAKRRTSQPSAAISE